MVGAVYAEAHVQICAGDAGVTGALTATSGRGTDEGQRHDLNPARGSAHTATARVDHRVPVNTNIRFPALRNLSNCRRLHDGATDRDSLSGDPTVEHSRGTIYTNGRVTSKTCV